MLPNKKGIQREKWKMENKRMGYINRDKNYVLNVKKITSDFLEYGSRPKKYRRDYKIEPVIKNKKLQPNAKIKKKLLRCQM